MNHKEVREFCEARGIMALAQPTQFTPKIKPDFSFRKEHVVELVGFWCMGEIAMMLRGPSGCGKTALIEQFHAAMNYPLLQPSTHARTEAPDLNGQIIPSEGGFKYVYGLLVQAARHGLSVFLDEYNVMDSSVTTSLNPILEGGKIDIPETGETIFPKEGFRVFAACNPNDKGLGFFGRNEEDASNKERFWVVEFGYPKAHDGVNLLTEAGVVPLLVCDLWEHAYYLDHKNDREGFLKAWFDALPNWTFAQAQYDAALMGAAGWTHPGPA